MKFHEKLSLLMDIAKTTNQELALYSCLDSSHISRLKNGKRKPVKGASYLMAFARFLARRLSTLDQQDLLRKLLNLNSVLPLEQEHLTAILYHWLTKDCFTAPDFTPKKSEDNSSLTKEAVVNSSCSIYFKTEGKRLAALDFLERIAKSTSPQTLLLFSDEDMTWMMGDLNFTKQWSHLMKEILMKGSRIQIIHDLNRGLDEVLAAIRSWIPLYMTGGIEPYYYPRIRDGIYKRSLYIAPGLCAVTSSSIGKVANSSEETATFLFTERKAIAALQKEFDSYLALCLPLMKIFTTDQASSSFDLLASFEKKPGSTIIKTKHLSSVSLPETALLSILQRTPQANEKQLLAFHQFRAECLERTLQDYSITEIFSIPSWNSLCQGEVMIDHSVGMEEKPVYYTKEEYRLHLEHVLHLLQRYENYHVSIENTPYDPGYSISAKENAGALVIKNAPPLVFLSIAENHLASGFRDFLMKLGQNNELSKTSAIEQLKCIVTILDDTRTSN